MISIVGRLEFRGGGKGFVGRIVEGKGFVVEGEGKEIVRVEEEERRSHLVGRRLVD